MPNHRLKFPLVALVLAFAAAGCEDVREPLAPEFETSPRFSEAGRALRAVPAAWQAAGGCVSAWAGPSWGAALQLGAHRLAVPANAVQSPTLFEMCPVEGDHIEVRLAATSVGSADRNDVGRAGFRQPVDLTLSYASGRDYNESALTVAWKRPDGVLEAQPSVRDAAKKTVTGYLRHFSGYIVAD